MVFDLIVSALVTVLVVTLTDGILASAHRCGR